MTFRETYLLAVALPITFPFAGYMYIGVVGLLCGMACQLAFGLTTIKIVYWRANENIHS